MRKILFLLVFSCIFAISCENDTAAYFPRYEVRFSVDLNTEGLNLKSIGGYFKKETIKGTEEIGCGGVLIYHTINDTYCAFDMACPAETSPNRSALVSTPDDKGIVKCSKCGSTFNIFYGIGNPVSGIAVDRERRLQPYNVVESGSSLIISN